MARSAADLGLELAVVAGPDELAEGVGYKLALPPPRHDRLADFRVLVIDATRSARQRPASGRR
jgi:amidase